MSFSGLVGVGAGPHPVYPQTCSSSGQLCALSWRAHLPCERASAWPGPLGAQAGALDRCKGEARAPLLFPLHLCSRCAYSPRAHAGRRLHAQEAAEPGVKLRCGCVQRLYFCHSWLSFRKCATLGCHTPSLTGST